jgi:IS5 family transposase
LTMFKIVLLQQWHTLSDPAAEEAVRDRLSFRRFCGLPLDMETPDHASIWRFRQTIDKLGLSTQLLAEVNRQLDALGLVIKRGTLVDATLIAGAVRRPYEGGGVNPRDPEARFTRKRDKTYFGYKAHLAVDEASGFVRQAEMTSANVHDSRLGEALIQGDEQGFFADRAYDSQALRETLERRGLIDGIAWKVKHARYPLESWQQVHNAWASSVRSAVERAFATMKHGSRDEPGPLPGACPQRLPSAVRRHGDEHEAGARADGTSLIRRAGQAARQRALRARHKQKPLPLAPNPRPPVRSAAR